MHARRACVVGVGFYLAVVLMGLVHADGAGSLTISSPDFAQGKPMPKSCALHGENRSPHLEVRGVPAKAKYLVLIMDDPDAPAGLWTHWLLWNIWPNEGEAWFGGTEVVKGARVGRNSFGNVRYDGPAPPNGTHRYFFHVFALDEALPLPDGASREEIVTAMQGHIVAQAEFYGTYSATP